MNIIRKDYCPLISYSQVTVIIDSRVISYLTFLYSHSCNKGGLLDTKHWTITVRVLYYFIWINYCCLINYNCRRRLANIKGCLLNTKPWSMMVRSQYLFVWINYCCLLNYNCRHRLANITWGLLNKKHWSIMARALYLFVLINHCCLFNYICRHRLAIINGNLLNTMHWTMMVRALYFSDGLNISVVEGSRSLMEIRWIPSTWQWW